MTDQTDRLDNTPQNKPSAPRRASFRDMPLFGKRGEKMPNGQRFVSMRVKFLGVLGVTGISVVIVALLLIPLSLRLFDYFYNTPEQSTARMDRFVGEFADHVAREQISSTDNAAIVRWTRLHPMMYITVFTDGGDEVESTDVPTESVPSDNDPSDDTWGSAPYEPFFDRLFPGDYIQTDPADGTLYSVRFANGHASVAVVDNSYPLISDLIVVAGVVLAMVVFSCVVLVYYHNQTRAIVTLALEVEAVSSGAGDDVITPNRNDEIGMLARDVDIMRRTIVEKMEEQERAWQANRDLLTSMTHDLRTPLTTLLGYMELLGAERDINENLTEEQRAYIRVCTGKAEQIKLLSDKLFLYFWAYNRPEGEIRTETFDAELLFGQLIGNYIPAMEVAGLMIESDLSAIPAGTAVSIDPDSLQRVTDNLFDNLAKYADPSEPVRITASVQLSDDKSLLLLRMENSIASSAAQTTGTRIGHKTCHHMMTLLRGSFRTETIGNRFVTELTLPLYPL